MEYRRGFMELNMLLSRLDPMRRFGSELGAVAALASAIDVNKLEKMPKAFFKKKLRRELLLEPLFESLLESLGSD